ncbi:MAG: hypothetical protein LBV60_21355, partial [Streptomyces sp.]|nr:hypothetical protein [Streptomyces sp.]
MTITLPWRGTGSRRAVDKLATLERQLAAVQTDNAQLLAHRDAALAHIEDLRDRHAQTYKAWEEEAQLRGEAEMAAALTQSQLEDAQADIDRLETEVRALRAQIANLTAVTVP